VVGAIGDFQDSRESKLVSYNRVILSDAESVGDVEVRTDIRFYGRDSRPLAQFLQYCSDPTIPGITDNAAGAQRFFAELGIQLKNGDSWRTWNDLRPEEKETAIDALKDSLKNDPASTDRLCGEVYNLPKFDPKTGLRDSKEYATVLNACGRYDDAETGLRICMGDRDAIKDADKNRTDHRRNISVALSYVKDNRLIRERRFIQYFDAGAEIRETVVGIVAGMLLNSGEVKKDLPIFAFADADDGVKVSARASRALTDRGLDLSFVMKTASEIVGGYGGGHSVAAGATIPRGMEDAFLDAVEDIVSSQVI
jgi:RecJ-like exonuclease